MKTLEEQIAVMQHAAEGGDVMRTSVGNGSRMRIIDCTTFNWHDYDYDIVKEPEVLWVNKLLVAPLRYAYSGVRDAGAAAEQSGRPLEDFEYIAKRFVESPEE
jgi:hypothetical protein